VIRIKVSGITSLTDARYCAGMGVEFLSLQFENENNLQSEFNLYQAVRPWIEGVKWMAEYYGNDNLFFEEIYRNLAIDSFVFDQIPSMKPLQEQAFTFWQRIFPVSATDALPDGNLQIHLDNHSHANQMQILEKAFEKKREVILGNILKPDEAIVMANRFPDLIFNLHSGKEERPGWMDLSSLQDYLEALDNS
jgi:phosphoribosylanthranilate isomerase